MTAPVLEVQGLSRAFGGVQAVNAVTFALRPGEIVGLIGPNGAGKTTLVNLISGGVAPSAGVVRFDGHDVTGQRPWRTARMGLARTFQIVQPFPEMTVLENVAAGALFAGAAATRAAAEASAAEQLAFVGLGRDAERSAATLPLAGRKRLELAKSLAMRPKVLLLDEVNAGLNSGEIEQALTLIRRIAERGVTIVIIEHLMRVVLALCRRILVLHQGALIRDGEAHTVMRDRGVIDAYLGQRFAERLEQWAVHG
jgi:branched-chain amino acid transport system ATP-binding protein